MLRYRAFVQSGVLPGPQGRGAAFVRAVDLRDSGRHRRGAAQSSVRQGNGGSVVRKGLRLVGVGGGPASDGLHHDGRDQWRQRARGTGGFALYRQGRAGDVERAAGGEDQAHSGGSEFGNRHAGRGKGDSEVEGWGPGWVLSGRRQATPNNKRVARCGPLHVTTEPGPTGAKTGARRGFRFVMARLEGG